jgi:hypothetical protein
MTKRLLTGLFYLEKMETVNNFKAGSDVLLIVDWVIFDL